MRAAAPTIGPGEQTPTKERLQAPGCRLQGPFPWQVYLAVWLVSVPTTSPPLCMCRGCWRGDGDGWHLRWRWWWCSTRREAAFKLHASVRSSTTTTLPYQLHVYVYLGHRPSTIIANLPSPLSPSITTTTTTIPTYEYIHSTAQPPTMPDDQDDSPPPPKTTNAFASPLRLVPVAALVPAFALCLAHGVVSHRPAPAAGIAPLFVSAVSSLVLLRLRPAPAAEGDEAGAGADGEEEQTAAQRAREVLMHPIVIFALDALLAAALMLVLVYTWMSPGRRGSLAMLAAYATIPLLAAL